MTSDEIKSSINTVSTAILAVCAALAVILTLFTETLPTTKRIRTVVEDVGDDIVQANQEHVKECVDELPAAAK